MKVRAVKLPMLSVILLLSIVIPIGLWLLFATFMSLFGGSPFDNNPFDDLPFNRSQWVEDDTSVGGDVQRGHMAQDIILNHLKPNMPKQKIVSLLGSGYELSLRSASREACYPSQIYFSNISSQNRHISRVLRYPLGEELAMAWNIDRAELFIYLDDKDRYIGSQIGL